MKLVPFRRPHLAWVCMLLASTLWACQGGGGSSGPGPNPGVTPTQTPSGPTPTPGAPTATPTSGVATATPTASPAITPTPSPVPSGPTPTPSPGPTGALNANPTSLSITGAGAAYAQNVLVQETGFSGAFHETDTCSAATPIASMTGLGSGPSSTVVVTGVNSGTCSATFTDGRGGIATVSIVVTTTSVIIQGSKEKTR